MSEDQVFKVGDRVVLVGSRRNAVAETEISKVYKNGNCVTAFSCERGGSRTQFCARTGRQRGGDPWRPSARLVRAGTEEAKDALEVTRVQRLLRDADRSLRQIRSALDVRREEDIPRAEAVARRVIDLAKEVTDV